MLLTDNQPWNISLLDITLQLPWSSTHILANRGAIGNSAMASPYSVICFVRLSMPPRYSSNYIHQPMSMSRLEMISYSLPFLLYTSSLLVVVSGMESWPLDQCSWTSYWAQHLHIHMSILPSITHQTTTYLQEAYAGFPVMRNERIHDQRRLKRIIDNNDQLVFYQHDQRATKNDVSVPGIVEYTIHTWSADAFDVQSTSKDWMPDSTSYLRYYHQVSMTNLATISTSWYTYLLDFATVHNITNARDSNRCFSYVGGNDT